MKKYKLQTKANSSAISFTSIPICAEVTISLREKILIISWSLSAVVAIQVFIEGEDTGDQAST